MGEPLDKQFALRLPSDLYNEIEQWAKEEFRSVNSQMVAILRDAVTERRKHRSARRRAADSGKIETDMKTPSIIAALTTS